jgi:hypothetical protein
VGGGASAPWVPTLTAAAAVGGCRAAPRPRRRARSVDTSRHDGPPSGAPRMLDQSYAAMTDAGGWAPGAAAATPTGMAARSWQEQELRAMAHATAAVAATSPPRAQQQQQPPQRGRNSNPRGFAYSSSSGGVGDAPPLQRYAAPAALARLRSESLPPSPLLSRVSGAAPPPPLPQTPLRSPRGSSGGSMTGGRWDVARHSFASARRASLSIMTSLASGTAAPNPHAALDGARAAMGAHVATPRGSHMTEVRRALRGACESGASYIESDVRCS